MADLGSRRRGHFGASQFSVSPDGTSTTVSATGELDLATRDALRSVLAPLTGTIVLDLEHVTLLDSSTIGVLVATRNRLFADGGDLRLRIGDGLPRRSLELVGLEDWIDDEPRRELSST